MARLVEMGFTDDQSRQALHQHGSVSNAVSALTDERASLRNGHAHGFGRGSSSAEANSYTAQSSENRRGGRGGRGRGKFVVGL